MFPKNVQFFLRERPNSFLKSRKDWALSVKIDDKDPWVVEAWAKKPNEHVIENVINLVVRSFEIYHKHIQIPQFKIDVSEIRFD